MTDLDLLVEDRAARAERELRRAEYASAPPACWLCADTQRDAFTGLACRCVETARRRRGVRRQIPALGVRFCPTCDGDGRIAPIHGDQDSPPVCCPTCGRDGCDIGTGFVCCACGKPAGRSGNGWCYGSDVPAMYCQDKWRLA